MFNENIIAYWEEPERIEVLANTCGWFQKTAGGFGDGGSSAAHRKLLCLPQFKFGKSVSIT